ncbi:PIN domain-containing protein [Profundibacter amoris]|uniref:DUF4935 domain-containing protein n=1 Tax=Profundibacter amoris TaxID=2171755 RepID=A0A347UDR3_9RHOB|nr:PIN domain-containing protein [Profundibacter amoris]AXX96991.1 hypothetical protein BAR1_03025 [Profundibacter amoris]
MAQQLFLDANIFLSFFQSSKDDLVELAKVVKLIGDEEIILYSNDQLRREVDRNRENKIATGFNEFKNANFGKEFPHYCNDYSELEEIRSHLKEANKIHAKLVTKINTDIENRSLGADKLIAGLFELAEDLPITAEIMEKVHFRVASGDPPGKRNSIGDAIHWQCLLDQTKSGNLDLVTLDGDFTSPLKSGQISDFLSLEWSNSRKWGAVTLHNSLSNFFKARFPQINLSTEFKKDELVRRLINSPNFSETHQVISELMEFEHFTKGQIRQIFSALLDNNQVRWIAMDCDVQDFFKKFSNSTGHLGSGPINMLLI